MKNKNLNFNCLKAKKSCKSFALASLTGGGPPVPPGLPLPRRGYKGFRPYKSHLKHFNNLYYNEKSIYNLLIYKKWCPKLPDQGLNPHPLHWKRGVLTHTHSHTHTHTHSHTHTTDKYTTTQKHTLKDTTGATRLPPITLRWLPPTHYSNRHLQI